MTAVVVLAPVLDLRAAEPVRGERLGPPGRPVRLDGSAVERLGGLCLQLLLSAIRTWRADGQALTFINASKALTTQWSAFGASPSDLSAQDEIQ